MLVVEYMNEDINLKRIQEFMVEIGLYGGFDEVNEVEEKNREDAYEYECGSKCVDFVLRTEGIMKFVDRIEF